MEYLSEAKAKGEHCKWGRSSRYLRPIGAGWFFSAVAGTGTKRAEMKRRKFMVSAQPKLRLAVQAESSSLDSGLPHVECTLEAYEGGFARCVAEVAGAKIWVNFPAAPLLSNNLRAGARFVWLVRSGVPTSDDIREASRSEDFTPEAEIVSELEEFLAESETGVWAPALT